MATYNALNTTLITDAGSLVPISDTTIQDSNVILTIDGTYDEHFIIFNECSDNS